MCYAKLGNIAEANRWASEAMPDPGPKRDEWARRMLALIDGRLAELGEQDRFGERLGERSSSSGLSSAISGASTLAGIGAGSACQPASAARQRWPTARSAEGELSELSAPRDRTLWFGAWWGRSTRELALMCACACVRGHGHA